MGRDVKPRSMMWSLSGGEWRAFSHNRPAGRGTALTWAALLGTVRMEMQERAVP